MHGRTHIKTQKSVVSVKKALKINIKSVTRLGAIVIIQENIETLYIA